MASHASTGESDIRVCLAGATGWAGSALARGLLTADGITLACGVSRKRAGQDLGVFLESSSDVAPLYASAGEALACGVDVFVEYTNASVAEANVSAALKAGAHVVVGTSGLGTEDYDRIDRVAQECGRGVLACGNFALTAVLMARFSEMAARWVKQWEIIDYAHAGKRDAPSGTARELAHRLAAAAGESELAVPLAEMTGEPASRGVRLEGSQVHSVRLPGFVIAIESIFGLEDQKLVMRHEAGSSAAPYVAGAILAIRRVGGLVGLHRGLDAVMDGS